MSFAILIILYAKINVMLKKSNKDNVTFTEFGSEIRQDFFLLLWNYFLYWEVVDDVIHLSLICFPQLV